MGFFLFELYRVVWFSVWGLAVWVFGCRVVDRIDCFGARRFKEKVCFSRKGFIKKTKNRVLV